jgi:two-component system sensor histidine kinase GlrK
MRLTIFQRLTITYIILMLLILFLGTYVTLQLNRINGLTRDIGAVDLKIIRLTDHLLQNIEAQVKFEKKYFIAHDHDFFEKFLQLEQLSLQQIRALQPLMHSDSQQTVLERIRRDYAKYAVLFKTEVHRIADSSQPSPTMPPEARAALIEGLQMDIATINAAAGKDRDEKIEITAFISAQVLKVFGVASVLAVIFAICLSYVTTRGINRSLQLLKEKTREISRGQFKTIAEMAAPPEIQALADDFDTMCARLKELDEMKEDFISHVSHELRTPLTAIREASEMLLEIKHGQTDTRHVDLLNIIREECERLIRSVNRILDLSCMEAQKMTYYYETSCIVPVIRRTILKLAPISQRQRISLEFTPPLQLPPVQMDEERMGQVIENLIGNALKFTSCGGQVVVKALSRKDGRKKLVEVSICDTGCGMSESHLTRVFDKFRRITDGKQTVRGTGLGLAICKHIVTAHGGKIWVQSKPGKGSTFYFTLPAGSC